MIQKISLTINAILVAAVAWLFAQHFNSKETITDVSSSEVQQPTSALDTSLIVPKEVNAKIAYFEMDSVIQNYKLMQEKSELLQSEEQRLTRKVERERQAAQARYNELMNKDRTYSTMAEMEADQKELEELMARLQQLEESSMNDLMLLQQDVMVEIVKNLQDYLAEYNEAQKFDYIISMQAEGQIWSGNPSLDITSDVLSGLNKAYDEKKARNAARTEGK